jgi:hypothetical protein
MWFGDQGGEQDGTADDPRIVLIGVEAHAAVFLEVDKPQPIVLYELVKGWLIGAAGARRDASHRALTRR